MRRGYGLLLVVLVTAALGACETIVGDPVDMGALEHQGCTGQIECKADGYCSPTCGVGRYCLLPEGGSTTGTCWTDCRVDRDCTLIGEGLICDVLGRCVPETEARGCLAHRDCPGGQYCDPGTKRCVEQGGRERCSVEYDAEGNRLGGTDSCAAGLFCNSSVRGGYCSPYCRSGDDCANYLAAIGSDDDLTCTPFGLCLQPEWRDWVEEGERIRCYREGVEDERLKRVRVDRRQDYLDGPCVYKGWNYACGEDGFCEEVSEQVDYGARDTSHPGDPLVGTWGMLFQVSTITHGLPIVGSQGADSANYVLARLRLHGDKVRMDTKICDIDLINFDPPTDLAWMNFPSTYMPSLRISHQDFFVSSSAPGTMFDSDPLLDVRGAILADERVDHLPRFQDEEENPAFWSTVWDQDADNQPGMTVLMDGTLRAEIYNTQRWGDVKHGKIYDLNHIGGLQTSHSEQYMLGANPAEVLYHSEVMIHEDRERTYFRMMRLDDNATCDDVILNKDTPGHWLSRTDHYGDVPVP